MHLLMERIKRLISNLPSDTIFVSILVVVFLGILVTNFPSSGHFLTGWDNLHPEFNFPLNFKRIFEGVWQSNEGLGVIGGHGYAATAPHTIFLWLLSFIFPLGTLRALFTFLMLLVGSLGVYFITKYLLQKGPDRTSIYVNIASLFAGLFYMLNIGTVQNFYIQLEAFIVHFAFLPWFVLALWNFLENKTKKSFFFFILANVLILPAQFIPPLFIVEGIIVFIILFAYLIKFRKLKRILATIAIIICINAFWLLPFSYYTLTHSSNYLNAYNNLQSTSDFIQKNQKYGNIQNVALVKSFLFEAYDIDASGNLFPILNPWIKHFNSPYVRGLGYGFFGLSIIGAFVLLLDRKRRSLASVSLLASYAVIFTLFATDTPPFYFVTQILRNISLFDQAFRITFTKFSIAYVFCLSTFLGIGVFYIMQILKLRFLKILFFTALFASMIFYALPSFKGNFIYTQVKIAIPSEYFNLFDYMKTQPEDARIMNLTQGWNWGWTLYSWGYTGSGFLWYGTQQPILDRAFDVWSPYNENYYWELVRALFAKDYKQLDSLLEKYNVSFVLYDPSVVSYPGEKQGLYSKTIGDYLSASNKFDLVKTFGKLKLYRVNLNNKQVSDVIEYPSLPNVLPTYNWNNNDVAFEQIGPYQSDYAIKADAYYPFRSLFSNRKVIEREVSINKLSDGYLLSSVGASNLDKSIITENYSDPTVPVNLKIKKTQTETLRFQLTFLFPTSPNGKQETQTREWTVSYPTSSKFLSLNANSDVFKIDPNSPTVFDKTLLFSVIEANPIVIQDNEGVTLDSEKIQIPPRDTTVENAVSQVQVKVPFVDGQSSYYSQEDTSFLNHKISDCTKILPGNQKTLVEGKNSYLVFSSNNESKECLDIILSSLPQDTGYMLEIDSKHIKGNDLQFALVNQQAKKTDFQLSLPDSNHDQTSYLFLPAMQPDGVGYSLHFENDSNIKGDTINYLTNVRLTPIPYFYMTNLRIGSAGGNTAPLKIEENSVKQIFPSVYKISPNPNARFVVLSQAYDPDWIMPGNTKHVIVNNWENGWVIGGNSKDIYVLFWPMILEYLGLIILPIPFLLLIRR